MRIYPEHTASFEIRVNQWISSQGIWFQLRHSTGKSAMVKIGGRLIQLTLRLLLLGVLVSIGVTVVLVKRTDSKRFRGSINKVLAAALNAKSAKVTGFRQTKDQCRMHVVTAEGGKESFFRFLELRGVHYRMGPLDGLVGVWDAGPVTVGSARIELKAGADEPGEAKASLDSVFRTAGRFRFDYVEVMKADLIWGYSERTRGYVSGTRLICQRTQKGWLLTFLGGTFGQNWLRNLSIDELVVLCTPEGLVLEKATFRQGKQGRVTVAQGKVTGLERPEVSGRLTCKGLDVNDLLPIELVPFVDGTISGELRVGGSINTQGGVEFEGEMLIGEGDHLALRDRLPLLRALSVVDAFNSYKKVDFTSGSFHIRAGGGQLQVEGVELEARDLVKLRGSLRARPPTPEEVNRALAEGPQAAETSYFAAVAASEFAAGGARDAGEEFTLKRAAEVARQQAEELGGTPANQKPATGALTVGGLGGNVREELRERYVRMPRYEGSFLMLLPGDAFDQARGLREIHPVDPDSGRIPLEVPIKGSLFELTLGQAEELYQKGKRLD